MTSRELGERTKNVLLTGSTGYVGSHLLAELLRDPDVTPICLVRADDDEAARRRLQLRFEWYFPGRGRSLSRAVVVAADISRPELSLSKARYAHLRDATTTIIHAAADVRNVAPPEDVFRANVDGTRNLLELAEKAGDRVFHYVSTMSVAGQNPSPTTHRFSEDDFDYGQHFRGAYDKSKFEAERLVRAYAPSASKGSIYRVDNVAADSQTGRFQINIDDNLTYHVFKALVVAHVAPCLPDVAINFSHVDSVAKAIVANVKAEQPSYCLHVTNPHDVPFDVVVSWLQGAGYPITVLRAEEFLERAKTLGRRHDSVFLGALWVSLTLANRETNPIELDHARSVERLRSLGVEFTRCDRAWWQKVTTHAVSVGFLPPL